jgi:hypothetical protein
MLREVEKGAENYVLDLLKFLFTIRGVIWLAMVLIALILVLKPDDSPTTIHTNFLLICFACMGLIPDLDTNK